MPTGYTVKIADGISFQEYALDCARNFGALIMMRDDPPGAEIPEFKPSEFYYKNLTDAYKKVTEIKKLSAKMCEKRAQADFVKRRNSLKKRIKEKNGLEKKYRVMLAEVEKYISPSSEYDNFKDFMKSQIEESIRFDCGDYYERELEQLTPVSGADWKKEQIETYLSAIERAAKSQKEENGRTAARNLWVEQLKHSLR